MNTKKIASIVALTMVVLAAGSMNVAAIPQIPEYYWGYAVLNGELAPIGTQITVEEYYTGQAVGSYKIQYGGVYSGLYALGVMIDDPESTDRDEGAPNGAPLTWKINGIECSTPAPGTDKAESGGINSYFTIIAHHSSCEGDTTPPTVTASLIPIDVEEDEGLFKVEFSATDDCEAKPDPAVIAVIEVPILEDSEFEIKCLGGIPVENGQIIYVEVKDDSEYEYNYVDGVLKIEAPEITLKVTAIDVQGNSATASANPTFAPEEG